MSTPPNDRHKVRCPECLAAIYLKSTVQQWDPITCHECHTALEVTNRAPLEVDYMYDDPPADDDAYAADEG